MPPPRTERPSPALAVCLLALLGGAAPLLGQSDDALNPGDVVRVDHEFVGTLMSIDAGRTLTLLGEGKPTCWPGIGHGEGPRCDPAPVVRRVVEWHGATIERQLVEIPYLRRTIVGGLLGAIALAPVGYLTGPTLGYGKLQGCVEVTLTQVCDNPISREDFDTRQRARDQRRGTAAFAVLGASIGAIVARKTIDEWVVIEPPGLADEGAWSLSLRVPLQGR